MTWQNITVQQFQDITRLIETQGIDDIDRTSGLISIMTHQTEQQVEELPMPVYNQLAKECGFVLQGDIPGNPVRRLRVGRRLYKMVYNPRTLTKRQYVEIITFAKDPIKNMHLIMASLVKPVRWGIARKNDGGKHAEVAGVLLNARFVDVYHSCVFFCKLYSSLMKGMSAFLVNEAMKQKKITMEEAEKLLAISMSAMDGFIQPKR